MLKELRGKTVKTTAKNLLAKAKKCHMTPSSLHTPKDVEDVASAVREMFNFVAMSFVQSRDKFAEGIKALSNLAVHCVDLVADVGVELFGLVAAGATKALQRVFHEHPVHLCAFFCVRRRCIFRAVDPAPATPVASGESSVGGGGKQSHRDDRCLG